MQFISFDLETTGFIPGIDQITEIAAIKFVDGEIDSLFATLVNPGRNIPAEVTRITGITEQMVQGQPNIESLLESFSDFCGNTLMVAHNAPFDFQFLQADFKKFECPTPSGLVLDTCAISRKVFPGLMNYKLGTLVQHLKIQASEFHRAEQDAISCGKLFLEITKKLSVGGSAPAIETLSQISGGAPLKFPKIQKQPKQLDFLGGL